MGKTWSLLPRPPGMLHAGWGVSMWVRHHFWVRWAAASGFSAVVMAAICAALAGTWMRSACFWGDAACRGVRLGGTALSTGLDVDAWLGEKAHELSSRPIEVTVQGVSD